MIKKIKEKLNKLKITTKKHPDWKDIVREELLKDFDFECEDTKKNEQQLSLLKQKFNATKTLYFTENFVDLNLRYFLLRLWYLLIGTYYVKLGNKFNLSFFGDDQTLPYLISFLHILVFILVLRLLFKYPFAIFNRQFHNSPSVLYKSIRKVNETPLIKLQNFKLFHSSFNFIIIELWIIVVFILFYNNSLATVNWTSDMSLFRYFQFLLFLLPTFFKLSERYFPFKKLFSEHQIKNIES